MQKSYYYAVFFAAGVAVTSCSSSETSGPPMVQEQIIAGQSLADYGIPAHIQLPKDLIGKHTLEVKQQPGSGFTVLEMGEDFKLLIRRENTPLDQFKTDWEGDMVFQHEILEDTEEVIYAKTRLPDGSAFSHKIVARKKLDDSNWIIKSDPTASISSVAAERIVDAVKSMQPEDRLASK